LPLYYHHRHLATDMTSHPGSVFKPLWWIRVVFSICCRPVNITDEQAARFCSYPTRIKIYLYFVLRVRLAS
jgi:hypothetical protein